MFHPESLGYVYDIMSIHNVNA